MATYAYKARDANGKKVSGTMESASKTELIDKLHKMGYMTTSISESASEVKLRSIFDRFKRIHAEEMLMFYIQMSNMINAGITILMTLSTLARQTENKRFKETILDVAKQVEGGSTLSQAFSTHFNIFTRLFVNMIKAGEASGNLDKVLMRYAVFFENQEDLKEKIRGALFYPVILLFFGTAVMFLIITFVIPQFVVLYLKSGVQLPTPTLIVYKIGVIIKNYWYMLIAAAVIILAGVIYFAKTPKGTLIIDRLKLRIPVVGLLYRRVAISRFARTLSTLLGSGVPILESLEITQDIIGNEVLARAVADIWRYVEKGEKMSEPMKVSGEFPPDVVQMVAVGEETGNIDQMLNKIADFYDMTVNYTVKKLTTIIEPVFLVVMGCMVGLIMASMLMPIFDMVKTLRH